MHIITMTKQHANARFGAAPVSGDGALVTYPSLSASGRPPRVPVAARLRVSGRMVCAGLEVLLASGRLAHEMQGVDSELVRQILVASLRESNGC